MSGRLLALRPRALGDVVLITPALRALLAGHPGATLEVVTEPRYAPLLEPLPGVAKVWPLERSVRGTLALITALRRRRFDLVVDFFGNPRTALIAAWCGAASSVGYALRGRAHAYRRTVPRMALVPDAVGRPRREHAAATHVRLALAAGGRADGLDPRLTLRAADRARADELLVGGHVRVPEETVGLVAAGTWPAKTWPAVNAGRLARLVGEAGRDVLLLAGPGEDDVTETVRRHAPGVRVLPPCGVAELAAVIARLGAVVGTDSGPIHLAAALGRPTFAWFGPTDPDTWAPRGDAHDTWRTTLPCRGCDRTRCPHWNCMPELTAEAAAARVLAHLERHGRAAADLRPAAGA